MRINKVTIDNFKCFKSTDIDFGKLTLLTGANSSGKSSILYSILGVLQSGEFPFQFSPNGKYVNMGNFREMSYNHLKENIIKVGMEIDDEGKTNLTTWWKEDKVRQLPVLDKLVLNAASFKLEIRKNRDYHLSYTLYPDRPEEKDFGVFKPFVDIDYDNNYGHPALPGLPNFRGKKSIHLKLGSLDEYSKLSIEKRDKLLDSIIGSLKTIFNTYDEKVNFISSFRLHPERTYYETTKTGLKVGKFGEDYVNQVILWETQKAKEYNRLIKIMKNLSLLDSISSKRLEGGRFELVVKVSKNSVPTSLNDVGFGISQFLPIVVSDLQLGEGSTLFVAQPEIHLHPSVQAEYGSYMVDQIKQAKKNYIIETHSEYLLNRIRLAIVNGDIPADDVNVYYFRNDGEKASTHRLEFTTDGRILNAPEDFFRTYQIDIMNIAIGVNGST